MPAASSVNAFRLSAIWRRLSRTPPVTTLHQSPSERSLTTESKIHLRPSPVQLRTPSIHPSSHVRSSEGTTQYPGSGYRIYEQICRDMTKMYKMLYFRVCFCCNLLSMSAVRSTSDSRCSTDHCSSTVSSKAQDSSFHAGLSLTFPLRLPKRLNWTESVAILCRPLPTSIISWTVPWNTLPYFSCSYSKQLIINGNISTC